MSRSNFFWQSTKNFYVLSPNGEIIMLS